MQLEQLSLIAIPGFEPPGTLSAEKILDGIQPSDPLKPKSPFIKEASTYSVEGFQFNNQPVVHERTGRSPSETYARTPRNYSSLNCIYTLPVPDFSLEYENVARGVQRILPLIRSCYMWREIEENLFVRWNILLTIYHRRQLHSSSLSAL